ncbi:hypothetical protein D9Q98_006233 [Chlorella vulgaris]|uniref:Uncharacterized protein n=1 Tax=Chlorella vulgaris TaxID=3077 RepID=A0A9D4TX73_CHLVU|nr:hypothetical protein D9Q98_006233 [Chlorella vulgaris]
MAASALRIAKAGGALQPQQQSQPQQQQQSQQSQQQQQQQQVLALQSQQQSVQAAPLDKDAAARASLPSSLQELKLATCQLEDFEIAHLRSERDILRQLDHSLLVRMHGCCQDQQCVYFIMEYVPGGEFFSHLKARGKLSEEAARLYAGEVLLMFEYLHSHDIVYRDLKPENLLLDASGHLKLTDFGFAKAIGARRTYTLCGTPDYLAPEIILNKGHGKAVDWWALGVLIYEMLTGYPPFLDDDALATYKKILKGNLTFPPHLSVTARDLIRKLLQVDLSKRYGCLAGGVNDIRSHPWFRPLDWVAVKTRQLQAPIRPAVCAPDDTSNFEDYSDLEPMTHASELSVVEQASFAGF